MKRSMGKLALAFALAAIAACSDAPKTVEYYKAHPDELEAMLERSRNDPGWCQNDRNCSTAIEADAQQHMRNVMEDWGKRNSYGRVDSRTFGTKNAAPTDHQKADGGSRSGR